MSTILHPAASHYLGIPGVVFGWIIVVLAVGLFGYTIYKRLVLLKSAQADPRFSNIGERLKGLLTFGILQKRQPRYLWAGILHIVIFWGFVVLGLRSLELVMQALGIPFLDPLMKGPFGGFYGFLKDLFELLVLAACIFSILRRAIARPARYAGSHQFEAYLVLGLISFLMVTDMLYEGSLLHIESDARGWLPAAQIAAVFLPQGNPSALKAILQSSYWLHILALFCFLNLLPLSKHFHIITALPNVFFRKLKKGAIKPLRWDVEDIDELESSGAGKLEDFTWKHVLDFYTCTECGRCSDNCPAYAVGRPLSPKMITIKLRDYAYSRYPVFGPGSPSANDAGKDDNESGAIIGAIIEPDEVWSCTTCGACEEECPVFIEYIDKMIDMRRYMVETGQAPKTFNQILMQFEKTGNPFGKPAAKRAEWTQELADIPVKILKDGDEVDVLYFVDSYGSYDPRVQEITRAIASGLHRAGVSFGVLGRREKDSGHQVRRMGEEGLFQMLLEENVETFQGVTFRTMVTTDPHAFNTILKDYPVSFPVIHYSAYVESLVRTGRLQPVKPVEPHVYTYHDPCYLGRHNGLYDPPRNLLRSLPGMRLVEMERSRDRSFCCGGGDIILWHEIEQEEVRMAAKRIEMARSAGADCLVTACPFCLIHFEDAIKTAGLENEMKVIDLMELTLSTL
ncbi:(Fe-S)-binding protein [Desulfatiglans anilini]|uniref:(Fe-S)-binding protein n=1 Tax=Desulfatiglans anilini TaxID=90728 RepID=UPI0003F8D6EF|nr:(Fe-S)-binding protein [Desulfatiglans anilini]